MNERNCGRGRHWTFQLLMVLLTIGLTASVSWQSQRTFDYLNEKLRIPDSELFHENDYVETGVGLTFGVDRRLSYFTGKYDEAAQQFEKATQVYPLKSEIWVYLSRAYFYKKEPDIALAVLRQAAQVMPDLEEGLWLPLERGLNREIRKRANDLQLQIDFYSRSPEDYFTLFRLYQFLEDKAAATMLITAVETKASNMIERAGMASGNDRKSYLEQAGKWRKLGANLRTELGSPGLALSAARGPAEKKEELGEELSELAEATRLLQLRVDFYQYMVGADEYQKLFDSYLKLKKPEGATEAIKALERGIKRLQLEAVEARDYQRELELREQVKTLEKLGQTMRQKLAIFEREKRQKEGVE